MAIDLAFRRRSVRTLTNEIGCYVLCDLDQVPIYVGQSVDGDPLPRHLTSARSDIIANRQIDVWRIQGKSPERSRRTSSGCKNYHRQLLGLAIEVEGDTGDD